METRRLGGKRRGSIDVLVLSRSIEKERKNGCHRRRRGPKCAAWPFEIDVRIRHSMHSFDKFSETLNKEFR